MSVSGHLRSRWTAAPGYAVTPLSCPPCAEKNPTDHRLHCLEGDAVQDQKVKSLIATLPSLLAIATLVLVSLGVTYLWEKDKKPYAVLFVLGLVALGLLVEPTWTFVLVVVGLFAWEGSFIKTTRGTMATAFVILGLFVVFFVYLGAGMDDYRFQSRVESLSAGTPRDAIVKRLGQPTEKSKALPQGRKFRLDMAAQEFKTLADATAYYLSWTRPSRLPEIPWFYSIPTCLVGFDRGDKSTLTLCLLPNW